MNLPANHQRLDYLLTTLWKFRLWWSVPAVAGLVLACCYALFVRGETWSARQSFIVRDDLTGQSYKPGRFESLESMKSAQETILEISRRPEVIRKTLEKLGPASGAQNNSDWINDELIEDIQGSIAFSAPNGAEFGKTEVIVLTAKSSTRDRVGKFIDLLSQEIVAKVNQVRSLRLQGIEAELIQARDGAVTAQRNAEQALQKLDKLLGPDVGVMNALNDSQAGDTPMRREILEIKNLKRALKSELEVAESTRKALFKVYDDPSLINTLSSDILREQPALETMKTELVKLQRELALALAAKHDPHPQVRTAKLAVKAMETQIFHSLEGEIEGLQASIERRQRRLDQLNQDIRLLEQRLVTLSENRAEHLRLTTEVRQLTEAANSAQSSLAEIQSLAKAARSVGLLTPVDRPQVSSRPDGAGKKVIAMAGAFGGLVFGLGLVMLIAPPMVPSGPSGHGGPNDALTNQASSNVPSASASRSPGRKSSRRWSQRGSAPAATANEAAESMKAAATLPQSADLRQTLEDKALPQASRSTGAAIEGPPEHRTAPVSDAQPAETNAKTSSPVPGLDPQSLGTAKPRVRPVDLIKSAEESTSFLPTDGPAEATTADLPAGPSRGSVQDSVNEGDRVRTQAASGPLTMTSPKSASGSMATPDVNQPSKQEASPSVALPEVSTGGQITTPRVHPVSMSAKKSTVLDRPVTFGDLGLPAASTSAPTAEASQPASIANEVTPTIVLPTGEDEAIDVPDQIRKLSESIAKFVERDQS